MRALELIILAAVAAVVLFQLYAVLGRRVGRGPEDGPRPQTAPAEPVRGMAPTAEIAGPAGGLAAVRARDPSFDVAHFVTGARSAYTMIVTAFASGDLAALRGLLTPSLFDNFEAAVKAREAEGRSEAVEFLHTPRADFEGVEVSGDVAKAAVRFLAEFRSRTRGPEGEAVEDRRTAEVWTFERNLKSRNPNWLLVHVDAAEA